MSAPGHLDLRGHPLHTRALSITLTRRADGRLDVAGSLLDLRKRGFVPVGGELQPSGIVHHMLLDGIVDPATRTLDTLAARQPAVAFEATALTRGESCRDLAGRVEGLAGTVLDDGFARRLSDEIGGPRGCSHVLTLAQLLGPTIAWALSRGVAGSYLPGQRVFRRDLVVDGSEIAPGRIGLALQLTDLHHLPTPEPALPMDRFGAELEVRGVGTFALDRFAFADDWTLVERRRTPDDLDAAWRQRPELAQMLAGKSLTRGVSAKLLALAGEHPGDRPLVDALLMLPPSLIQMFAALSDGWPAIALAQGWMIGMGSSPDACYMWRRGGALELGRSDGDPPLMTPGLPRG